ncbi:MAG: cystathionine gamma-synthase [Gemmatimonadales bacterium]
MTRIFDDDLLHGFGTRAVHAGQRPDEVTGAIMPPIYQTSTYVQDGLGRNKGFEYARTRNATRDALERNVAALEGARHGHAFSSGMAATDAILKLFDSGNHIVSGENLYGGTHRLMSQVFERLGLRFSFVDTRNVDLVAQAITPDTKLVFLETPTNPMMRLADLAALCNLARDRGVLVAVDNTFATPYFQLPFELGADIVLHSTTKYLNGHSDVVGGFVAVNDDDLSDRLAFLQNAAGAIPGPMDAWLTLRGTKTLALRMERHDASGRKIAAWLDGHASVERVYYPGLESHEQFELAARQMKGFGGMISIELGDPERARRFAESTRIFALAESLGGVESLIGHPVTMTHGSVPREIRESIGLTDSLVRLSVGIEDTDDLIEDLDRAFHAAN